MEENTLRVPTAKELESLNPEGIEINMDLIKIDADADVEDLVQDTFNTDSIEDLNDGEVDIENAE